MTSIDEFYFRYYANRLLREGYIDQREYQALLTANQLDYDMKEKHTNIKNRTIKIRDNFNYRS